MARSTAERFGQNPYMLTSFADGTKMSLEMAVVANATGLVPDVRGMHCPHLAREELTARLLPRPSGILSRRGVVEVVRGAKPAAAVFVVATTEDREIRRDLEYLKMGPGPAYLFYKPYHLCAIELAGSILDLHQRGVPTVTPGPKSVTQVFSVAKRDLRSGETLDRIGGYTFRGVLDVSERVVEEGLLPAGLAAGTIIRRDLRRGCPIRWTDVEVPDSVSKDLAQTTASLSPGTR